ncbi:hypothetical protein KVR01_007593 [Diaporthe batatas]|uniref:uncharacterized protein n=1 Tax=Diaporthe batatas TaxID=748121 RepID=UPI001D05B8E6|nr:uncharacterized protein KVR01_007593 [Diaporthe batatas]KAG8163115.1 hypothetical protein KVR01_007593 [Diaporthe batatas]
MAPEFDITPEKQSGLLYFWKQQISYKPTEVHDVDLKGCTAIITGSNTGVGFQTSQQLLNLGLSRLILAVRSEEKGKAAAAKLASGRDLAEGAIEVWLLDQSSYESVTAFANRVRGLDRLDFVNLNIGIAPTKREFNKHTGHDEVIQVNYLSTALIAILLLPIAKEKRANQPRPTRITFTSSEAACWTKFKEKDVKGERLLKVLDRQDGKVDMADRMWLSKLLGQFFIARLAAEVPPSVALINCASPSAIHDSEFNRDFDKTAGGAVFKMILRLLANSSAVGARMITDAIVKHGEETHGRFLSFQKLVPMAPIVYTEEGRQISEQLWEDTLAELSFANVSGILEDLRH